jgi:uncharacterized membrane-anchored protein
MEVRKSMPRQSKDVLQQWINDTNRDGKQLTDWELHFMESITEQFSETGRLSERQEEILERIYAEKTRL